MGTDNRSPSYLAEREKARRFLLNTPEGRLAAKMLLRGKQPGTPNVLDDDTWTDWEEIIKEHRQDTVIAANCKEAREAADLARQSSSIMAAPVGGKSKMRKIFSPPAWYALRRPIEVNDPNYWNDPKNIYREALNNPEWATQPADYFRAALADYLPKGKKVEPSIIWADPSTASP